MLFNSGRWDDTLCSTKLQFLCLQNPTEASMSANFPRNGLCLGRQSGGKQPPSKPDTGLVPIILSLIMHIYSI